jgi:nucleotide-binding universal stress UspA family protein
MTTHGRGPLSRMWLGSVADPLVRRLSVPTLLVRPTDAPPDVTREAPLRHLLIALDGTPRAEAVLPAAVELGELMSAQFTLVRVVKPVGVSKPDPSGGWTTSVDVDEIEREQAEARRYLNRLAAPLRRRGLGVRTRVVVHNDPSAAILEEGRRLGCDLIALETRGRHGTSRFILGSVTDKVTRGAAAPVLIHCSAYH